MTNYFVLTGHIPDQTSSPKRSVSISFGDTNASLRLTDWILNLYVNPRLFKLNSSNSLSGFSGRIHFQTKATDLIFNLGGINFDSTDLITTPGINYDATLEIEHPNLFWKIKEDITISAQLDQQPLHITVGDFHMGGQWYRDVNAIYANNTWLNVTDEMKIFMANSQHSNTIRPDVFGTQTVLGSRGNDLSGTSSNTPIPMSANLILLSINSGGYWNDLPLSRDLVSPGVILPSTFDIFDLETNDIQWEALLDQVKALRMRSGHPLNDELIGRIKNFKDALEQIWTSLHGRNGVKSRCKSCIHCKMYDELKKQGRPRTIARWLLTEPKKIAPALRPMIATVLMVPDGIWERNHRMAFYAWIHSMPPKTKKKELNLTLGGIFFPCDKFSKIIPTITGTSIRKTCVGYTSGHPIRIEFWGDDKQSKKAIVNWFGGLRA